jgi:hypothetical protein
MRRKLTISERIEFCWLWLISVGFRNSPDKRKSYYEYRLAKKHLRPF